MSVGAHVAGMVSIGRETWIGAGATIKNCIHITGKCMIGAGAVVVSDITQPGTYFGIPAKLRQTTANGTLELYGGNSL